jgi:glucose-1-phosphate adenylyltransferase
MRTITVVLGGGQGSRLYPLTQRRAKPAVPLAGKYRLIDIPLSNAINSGLREVFVLTQFNSASLNAHVSKTYRFDTFSSGFVEVLAAEQTEGSADWYQGTADAVRKQLHHFDRPNVQDVIILSGDHLYRMDYRELLARHHEANADITVSTIGVTRAECTGFGVLATDKEGMIRGFKEKPAEDEDISYLAVPEEVREYVRLEPEKQFLASMGVYVFKREALVALLATDHVDFGKDILPNALETHRVAAYVFKDYWADIGTIESFYDANLALCNAEPPFRFYKRGAPIYTRPRFLPPTKILGAKVQNAFIADGCLIAANEVSRSVIGLRSRLMQGCNVRDSIIMGADFYEDDDVRDALYAKGDIPVGVGPGASVYRAIIDKNARIGANSVIHGAEGRPDETHDDFVVRDGIIVVAKGAVIPPGSVL